jgi:hypothetical protein
MRRLCFSVLLAICGLSGPLLAADTSSEVRSGPHGGESRGWYQGDWGRIRSWSRPGYQRAIVVSEDKEVVSVSHSLSIQLDDEQVGSTMSIRIGANGSSSSGGLGTASGRDASLRIGSLTRSRQAESFFESQGRYFQGSTWASDR